MITGHSLRRGIIGAGLLLFALVCRSATTEQADSAGVIYQLYKEFGWVALFAPDPKADHYLGAEITEQPEPVLRHYFDKELSRLIVKEAACLRQHQGELCNLEFVPLYGSQDPAAEELRILPHAPDQVWVEYTYPATREKITLKYRLRHTAQGWRITDIVYPDANQLSLKALLSR